MTMTRSLAWACESACTHTLLDLGQILASSEARAVVGRLEKHDIPNMVGAPSFDMFSMLWQRSFSLPPASFQMMHLPAAAVAADS